MLRFNLPTLATCLIVLIGGAIATPALAKGFKRRGTGVKYERNFLIQRAPQFAALLNVTVITLAFLVYLGLFDGMPGAIPFLALTSGNPHGLCALISWLGVTILLSGMIFMVGGWYSLGEALSTDAEVLAGQTVRNSGLLRFVMHPIYSGIIQCLIGASLAATSLLSLFIAILFVAPLWLRRAKYEEKMLTETLGPGYQHYAESVGYRRLVPKFIPFGL
jgi:protein-S-isoprenylcysteine O-methyltransferase Ste14